MVVKSIGWIIFSVSFLMGQIATASDDFAAWKQNFEKQAMQSGVSEQTLKKFLPKMQLLPQVIKADKKQPEFVSTFWEYTDARLSPIRIQEGKRLLKKYPTWLKRVSDKYQVQPEFILAFWGLETNYGKTMGNIDVLNALTTLAYNPRRRTFFTKELIAFLKIMEKEKWDKVKGSWAGAFGHFQFMPTTFEAYAVDADNNGTRNVVASMPDTFASAANYLHQMGWNPNETWGQEVFLPQKLDWHWAQDNSRKTVADWMNMGIMPANGQWNAPYNMPASLLLPMGKNGPAFLTYPNFRRVMQWNKSELYALSVCFLADILSGKAQKIEYPRTTQRFSTEQVYQIQQRLAELGYYESKPDGMIGKKTRQAIMNFQHDKGVDKDGYPSIELLNLLNINERSPND